MITTIDISFVEYYVDTNTILYAYNSGGLKLYLDEFDRISQQAIEMYELGEVNGIRTPTYSDFKTNTANMGFYEWTHSAYTNIYVNCAKIKRVIDLGGGSTQIIFNNRESQIVTVAYSTVIANIATALKCQPLDATLTALADLSISDILNDLDIRGLNLLGSTIKGQNLGLTNTMTFTVASMNSGRVYWQAVYIPQDCTITGVKWGQTTQGNYTATAYNGVGLYSYSGGTLTQIAASTDDGAIWKGTASTMQTKAFSATVAVTKGIYYVAATYNQSAQTTAPALNALTTVQWLCNGDLTNSAKITGTTTATALPSPTQAISGVTASSTFFYFQLY